MTRAAVLRRAGILGAAAFTSGAVVTAGLGYGGSGSVVPTSQAGSTDRLTPVATSLPAAVSTSPAATAGVAKPTSSPYVLAGTGPSPATPRSSGPTPSAATPAPSKRAGAGATPGPAAREWTAYTASTFVDLQVPGDSYRRVVWKAVGSVTEGDGSYVYDAATTTETFTLGGTRTDRIQFNSASYRTGRQRLTGEIRVDDPAVDSVWVAQVFPLLLLRYEQDNGGQLVYHSASAFDGDPAVELTQVLATGVRGRWVPLEVVHDADRDRVQIRVDGRVVLEHPTGRKDDAVSVRYGALDNGGSDVERILWRRTTVYRD